MPENVEVQLTESKKYMIGFGDDSEWRDGAHDGDRPLEFLPAGGISIYLDEVPTTNNLSTNKSRNQNSNLCNISMWVGVFGQYFSIQYDNPMLIDLGEGEINQLELD